MENPILKTVRKVLDSEIDDESIDALVRLRVQILALRVEKQRSFLQALEQYRHPKDKELTDFDRKTMLEAATATIREEYEYAKGIEEIVKERIDLWLLTNLNN